MRTKAFSVAARPFMPARSLPARISSTAQIGIFRVKNRLILQTLQLGNRCATKLGIFGPGPRMPVGEVCAGMDANGSLVRGRVVANGTGKLCATGQGTFGPGLEQPIGTPCKVETKTGFVQGQISDTAQ